MHHRHDVPHRGSASAWGSYRTHHSTYRRFCSTASLRGRVTRYPGSISRDRGGRYSERARRFRSQRGTHRHVGRAVATSERRVCDVCSRPFAHPRSSQVDSTRTALIHRGDGGVAVELSTALDLGRRHRRWADRAGPRARGPFDGRAGAPDAARLCAARWRVRASRVTVGCSCNVTPAVGGSCCGSTQGCASHPSVSLRFVPMDA